MTLPQYHINLETFSINAFQNYIEKTDLVPSQRILKENLQDRMNVLKSLGIDNLAQLTTNLKTPKHAKAFAEKSGLNTDYVVILRRVAFGLLPKPVAFKDIPGIDQKIVEILKSAGILHSKHLFEQAALKNDRVELATNLQLDLDGLTEFVQLSDLARLYGTGPIFLRIFHDAGILTVAHLLKYDPEPLHKIIKPVNLKYTPITASLKDMIFILDFAKLLPEGIE